MSNEAQLDASVQRCCDAYQRVLAIPRPFDGKGSPKDFARAAYRQAMPYLTSFHNIDAFIACVAHGMLLGVIDYSHGSKLLYAAQVAIGSRRAAARAKAQPAPTPSPLPKPAQPAPAPDAINPQPSGTGTPPPPPASRPRPAPPATPTPYPAAKSTQPSPTRPPPRNQP